MLEARAGAQCYPVEKSEKMITKTIAARAQRRQEFLHKSLKDSRGNPVKCRVNGACKTWKTRPDDFQLPVKHGLKQCFYITPENAHEWESDPRDDIALVFRLLEELSA
jgi:hypothetical protein